MYFATVQEHHIFLTYSNYYELGEWNLMKSVQSKLMFTICLNYKTQTTAPYDDICTFLDMLVLSRPISKNDLDKSCNILNETDTIFKKLPLMHKCRLQAHKK